MPEFVDVGRNALDRRGRAFAAHRESAPAGQRLDRATDMDQCSGAYVAVELVENRLDLFEASSIKYRRFLVKLLRLGSIRRLANLVTADRERRPVGQIQFLKTRQGADQACFGCEPFRQ